MRMLRKKKAKKSTIITRTVTLDCGKVFVVEERPDGYGRILERK